MKSGYLTFFPQFCRESLNDTAWYPGFTDWNLIQSLPKYMRGRFTPSSGYYDLGDNETIARQFSAILDSPWAGMALYHYFFDGRFVLDAVERFILEGGGRVPPFFVIWANETWTKRWAGKPLSVIIRQKHSLQPEVLARHLDRLCGLMVHESYKRINGRPIFVIYSPYEIADIQNVIRTYRAGFRARGIDPLIGFCVSYVDISMSVEDFDFCMEFQPRLFFNVLRARTMANSTRAGLLIKRSAPSLFQALTGIRDKIYRHRNKPRHWVPYEEYLQLADEDYFGKMLENAFKLPSIRSAFFSWNNFPRYRGSALAVRHSPGDFGHFARLCDRLGRETDLYLVNSWNEWSEGAALEPGVLPPDDFEVGDKSFDP